MPGIPRSNKLAYRLHFCSCIVNHNYFFRYRTYSANDAYVNLSILEPSPQPTVDQNRNEFGLIGWCGPEADLATTSSFPISVSSCIHLFMNFFSPSRPSLLQFVGALTRVPEGGSKTHHPGRPSLTRNLNAKLGFHQKR